MLLMPRSFISNDNPAASALPSSVLGVSSASFQQPNNLQPYQINIHSLKSPSPTTSPSYDSSRSNYSSKHSSLSSESEGAYVYTPSESFITSQSTDKNLISNVSPLQTYSQGHLPSMQVINNNRNISHRPSMSQPSEDVKLPGVQELLSLAESSTSVSNNRHGYKVSPTLSQASKNRSLSTHSVPQQSQTFTSLAQNIGTTHPLKSDPRHFPPVIHQSSFSIESQPRVPSSSNQVFHHPSHLFAQSLPPYSYQQQQHSQQQQHQRRYTNHEQQTNLEQEQQEQHDHRRQEQGHQEQYQPLQRVHHQHNEKFPPFNMSTQPLFTALPEIQRVPFVHMGSDSERSVDSNSSRRYAPNLNRNDNNSVKPKRRRATPTQVDRLNFIFEKTFFPSSEKRLELARELNMTPRAVQIWFQNKRQGWKSEHKRPVPK